jgi:hypothetical protein
VPFRDDVQPITVRGPVATQEAGVVNQRILVRLLVIGAEFLTPIAAVVAAQVGGEVNLQRQGTVSGVDSP